MAAPISDISHVIQLSVAPVFLLAGIGAFINAFAGRLARIVDRSRRLQERVDGGTPAARAAALQELRVLGVRAHTIYLGITLGIASALLVCLLIVAAFLGHFLEVDLAKLIGGLFIASMLALTGGLLAFLREVFLAVTHFVVGDES